MENYVTLGGEKDFKGSWSLQCSCSFGFLFCFVCLLFFLLWFKLQFWNTPKKALLFIFLVNISGKENSLMFIKGIFLRTAWSHWMVSIFSMSGFEARHWTILNIWFSTFHQITCFIFYEYADYCSQSQEGKEETRWHNLLSFHFSAREAFSSSYLPSVS